MVECRHGDGAEVAHTRYAEGQKLAVVQEAVETGNCAVIGRRHRIAENLVSQWQFQTLGGVNTDLTSGGSEDVRACRTLAFGKERLDWRLGEKDLEIAVLKDLVRGDLQIGKALLLTTVGCRVRFQGASCLTCCGA